MNPLLEGRAALVTGGTHGIGLAIVEHLLMAFPLPLQRLWGWAMPPLPPLRASTANGTSVPVVAVVPAPAQVDRG